jgi:hypothetical protein
MRPVLPVRAEPDFGTERVRDRAFSRTASSAAVPSTAKDSPIFCDYYLGPLKTALGAMREGVDEIGEHSTTMLELASLSYDIRIQEKLKTMQWLSLGLAIASLMVAVAAILTAL